MTAIKAQGRVRSVVARLGPFRVVAILLAGLALSGCSQGIEPTEPPADPLLYEVTDEDGRVRGWLFGTIHALPAGTQWRTSSIEHALEKAGVLMVEIAGLEDGEAISRTFSELGTTPGLPPLGKRVAPDLRDELAGLMDRADLSENEARRIETWAAALMLARARADGSAANGVDRALIAEFKNRPVRELEGAQEQLAIFDRLTEADQRDLLREVVAGAGGIEADPAALRRAWLAGDEAALVEAGLSGILAHEGLRRALLVERNRAWLGPVLLELKRGTRPFVAVGAAHVVGPDGLAALIRRRGLRVMAVAGDPIAGGERANDFARERVSDAKRLANRTGAR